MASESGGHHIFASLTFWIRESSACGLHHLHSSKIMQVAPRHVFACHSLRKTISILQVRSRRARDNRSCNLYSSVRKLEEEEL